MTRKEYIDSYVNCIYNAIEHKTLAIHREYYAQFVDEGVRQDVALTVGVNAIKNCRDPHFNDIRLSHWDGLLVPCPPRIAAKMRELGDSPTLAGLVCIAKEAARQIKEEN